MDTITRTNLRKDLYNTFDKIVRENKSIEVTINQSDGLNEGVVILSKREYARMQEELYLERTGTLDYVHNLMENSNDDDFEEA